MALRRDAGDASPIRTPGGDRRDAATYPSPTRIPSGATDVTRPSDYVQQVKTYRQEKDDFFRRNPHSPLPPDDREEFEGLSYFPPDERYRFEVPLYEHAEKESIQVETTTEGTQDYLRWGEFQVEIDGSAIALQAYKADPDEDRLWVPFRDQTNGEETYGGGRYLDLEAEEHRTNDEWILDFNAAYNPFCAYSHRYECPLIPMDNWLEIPIEAGEKAYSTSESLDVSSLHGEG